MFCISKLLSGVDILTGIILSLMCLDAEYLERTASLIAG